MINRRIESPYLSDIEIAPSGKKVKIPISGGVIIGGDTDDSNNIKLHKANKDHLQVISGDDITPEGSYAPVSNFMFGGVPLGSVVSWIGGYFDTSENYINILGSTVVEANTYLNNKGWYVCDGSNLNDIRSPFKGEGRYLPILTNSRFLTGSNTIGEKGGSNVLTDHTHTTSLTAVGQGGGSHDHTYSLTAVGQTLGTTSKNSGNQSANHTHSQSSHNHTQNAHSHTAWTDSQGSHNHISPSVAHAYVAGAGPWGTVHTHLPQSSWGGYQTSNLANPANAMNSSLGGAHGHNVGISNTTATNNAATPPALGSNSVSHTHATDISHTHSSSSVSGVIDSTTHTHDSSSILGTVGSGNAASLTENRPKYLSCLYIMRIF